MITVLQFFLSLSILVVLHELGHFGAAKWFKTRVEKFYLFFNPGFSLFKKQIGETEYGVGWLPLGGYVKISGMIDESFDKEQMKLPPQPWEFRSKPAWQRLIIMVGGVFVNFVLGIFLFMMVLKVWGAEYILNKDLKDGIAVSETGERLGLRDGDQILRVGTVDFERFSTGVLTKELVINRAESITVQRDGQTMELTVDHEIVNELTKYENRNVRLVQPRIPYEIQKITEGGGAEKAGIQVGDKILAVNGKPAQYSHLFIKEMAAFHVPKKSLLKRLFGKDDGPVKIVPTSVNLQVERNGTPIQLDVPMSNGRIGVFPRASGDFIPVQVQNYSWMESYTGGWDRSITFVSDQLKAFGQMFSGKLKAKDSLGSFITIGSMFGSEWDWKRFWSMTASLSLLLGFINLLPIPALDGGYVMFLLFESLTGIKIPDRVMEIATFCGFLLLMALMIYAFGLDLSRVLK